MRIPIILLATCALLASGCKKCDDDPKPEDELHSLTLSFKAKFKDDSLAFSTIKYITAANDTISVSNLKYIMSEFKLQRADGSFWNCPDYGYISMVNGKNTVVLPKIKKDDYKSISFKVGLSSDVNFGDPAQWGPDHPLNPGVNGMHWGWAGGYIFNVVEGNFKNNGATSGYSFHVARLNNVSVYNFPVSFSLSADKTAHFDIQIDKYFSSPATFSLKTDGAISHSDPDDPVMDKFHANMVEIFDLVSVQ